MSSQVAAPRLAQANSLVCAACRISVQRHPTSITHPRAWLHHGTALRKRARPGAVLPAKSKSRNPLVTPPEGRNISHPDSAVTYTKSPLPAVIRDYGDSDGKGYAVRYFEQDESGVVRQLRNQEEFSQSWAGHNDPIVQRAKNLVNTFSDSDVRMPTKTEVNNLAAQITDISNSGAPPESIIQKLGQFVRGLSSPRVQQISPEAGMREILQAAENEAVTQIPAEFWVGKNRTAIQNLNVSLRRFHKPMRRNTVPSEDTFRNAWRRYVAARAPMALYYDKIHIDVWDLLWKMFDIEHENNPLRLTQISKLARDMSIAKIQLRPEQQVTAIEAMFAGSYQAQALENWKRCTVSLGAEDAPTYSRFWELGARMYCIMGDLDRAESIIEKLLQRQCDPRILIDFIHAAATGESPKGHDRAAEAYQRLRGLLGDEMTLIDFDRIISSFLSINHIFSALNVFVDMMTKGAMTINKDGKIPMIIANKFFFGKWLKRLIGNGELEGAMKVVRFMQQHRIPSSAIQLNGLIGAWQRSGSARDLANADALGWEMIRSRLEFVSTRSGSSKKFITEEDRAHGASIPQASLETFSLLAEDYHLRRLDKKLQILWDAFEKCEIPFNAFMMNQLMANALDFSRVDEALSLYNTLVKEKKLTPNPHTFMELWKALEVNRVMLLADTEGDAQIEAARKTFGEMMRHADVFKGEMNSQLARKVLHTFRRLGDRPGFVIALSMMRRFFNFMPSETFVLELVVGSTNLLFDSPHARHKVRIAKTKMESALFEIRRRNAGDDVERLPEDISKEERKELLFAYLRDQFLYGNQLQQTEPVTEEVLNNTARDMGLYDIGDTAAEDSEGN
ncbi:hypothetical protein CFIMG_008248RA00001 [Ceratocystis fimbriata CBS 114723]|uniref:Pentatricopeptide repeat domain-containing protein n=1 Tax=Ceratocystis fimbriata CBS 114723 TaxID=1035309 RepID=A0A2C5X5E3_9PEZI|nr:hypothetical protein CFIMG_008248RA00001 [Ceratocystis fimbriata CBS 114723]